jgi:RNA polymerase sigma factor (sigma-70 family)
MSQSDRLFDTYMALRSRLTRIVMGIVPPKEVEDIVQETYVRACQIENKDEIREPRSFMYRTAQNLAFDYLKRAETNLTSSVDGFDELEHCRPSWCEDETFAQVASNEEFGIFCDAVRHLPKQCRRAFVLKKVYGYSVREISEQMGVGSATVASHIITGTKKCVQYLRETKGTGSQRDRTQANGIGNQRGGES